MQIYDGRDDIIAPKTARTVSVVSCNRVQKNNSDHRTLRKNGRVDWSLFYCETGALYFGKTVLSAGQIWIYPPKIPQEYTFYKQDCTAYRYLHFTGSEPETLLDELGIPTLRVIEVNDRSLPSLFDRIRRNTNEGTALGRLNAERFTLELLAAIARTKQEPAAGQRLKDVTDTMEHSFAEEYDAARYAAMLNLSTHRFNHFFKEQLGLSPYAYYTHLRMINAQNLLEDTTLRIREIAALCGYSDPLYFTQAFKKHTGKTPSEYRLKPR